jgi:SAM-dependent methyltransferase
MSAEESCVTASTGSYRFPTTPLHPGLVQWTGRDFVIGGYVRQKVLRYDAHQSNWSDELTRLHEEEGGSNHPIDKASRGLAICSVRKHCRATAPVILDVGCSSGFLLDEFRSAFPAATIMGADYIAELLERLVRRISGIPILQFDLRNCPLPDASVDAITCLNVLEHIDDDARALNQIYRVLAPGGIAHIEVPAGPHLYDIYDEHLMHHRRYRLKELKRQCRDAGFQILEATHLGVFIYPGFSFIKRRHRRLLSLPAEEKKQIIARQIRRTSRSAMLDALLRFETIFGRCVSYPAGIRCVVVARKPAR